jgi:mannonate dehydratase
VKRRDFGKSLAAGAAYAAVAPVASSFAQKAPPPATARKKAPMYVGGMLRSATKQDLEYVARHGVFHVDGPSPKTIPGVGWDLEDALATKDACAKYGVQIDSYHIGIDRSILLGKSPERDKAIEGIQQMIQVAGKAGVRALFYNTVLDGNLRTGRSAPDPKRGNVTYAVWNYQEAIAKNPPLTDAGVVTADMLFDRIAYMIDRVMPVAEESKVQLGNHIADPPTHEGYRGLTRWDSPDVFAGIKRFAALSKSPYHGFNLCLGSTAEGLKDPNKEIHPIIKWVGEQKKIFNIHYRNIKGGWDHFAEVSVDDGDMDMYQVARTLRGVGYPYMVQPDHVLGSDDPAAGGQYTAFVYGYIKAMIQAVNGEVA